MSSGEVPSQYDRCDRSAREGSAHGVKGRAFYDLRRRRGDALRTLELGRVSLPKWKSFGGIFEAASQDPCSKIRRQHLSGMNSGHQKAEISAIIRNPFSALNDSCDLKGQPRYIGLQSLGINATSGSKEEYCSSKSCRYDAQELCVIQQRECVLSCAKAVLGSKRKPPSPAALSDRFDQPATSDMSMSKFE